MLVWFTMGIAIWHFTVFVPDRFRGGIVGAFLARVVGALVFGAISRSRIGARSAAPTSSPRWSRCPGALASGSSI